MADLFSIKNDKASLKCHQDDCAMNVFNFLDLIPTQEAITIANVTDTIYASRITDFLTDTFGVKFNQKTIWNKETSHLNDNHILSNLWDDLDEIIPSNKGIIIFIYKEGEIGHYAVIGKITDSKTENLYFIDPQAGHKFLLLNKRMDKIIEEEGYEKIDAFRADGPATRFKPNIPKFFENLKYNKNLNNIRKVKNTKHIGRLLKQVTKGVVTHHNLIKGIKYQVIDKTTRQPFNMGIFVYVVDGIATFKNGLLTFNVPLSEYNYIRIKKSVKKVRSEGKTRSETKRKSKRNSRKTKSA